MKKIVKFMFVVSVLMAMFIVPVSAEDVTYKIRSSVYDSTDTSTAAGDHYWDANSFSGFWYPIKPGLSSEVLYIHNSVNSSEMIQLGDTIKEGDLYYVAKPQKKKSKIAGSDDGGTFVVDDVDLEFIYQMGFFGPGYLVMPEDPSDPSQGCKPDEIAKIMLQFDSDDKKQMFSGEEWELAGGWTFVVDQVDVEGEKVWVHLKKNGEEIDSGVICASANMTNMEKTYLYKDSDDNPVFYCTVESIFSGTDTNFAVFKYAFLRGDITTIESDATYGIFDVEGFKVPALMDGIDYAGSGKGTVLHTDDDAVVLSSNKAVTLSPDKQIDLHAGLYLQTEDTDAPCLKMSLWKTCTIKVEDTATETEKDTEVVVVDLAEEDTTEKEESTLADTTDEIEAQTDEEVEEVAVESSVSAPGFGSILGFIGLAGAALIRK
ncbi:S-layer protein domain-containing protein [Methanolobus profundi]|uniref:S-layer family duplication domain-containing protein n=1 Tax=Methanolobus profundi TaxID=487685 RepID=A0A1I4PRY9_9EURY|nr:S-layer protein domain-containing protein [Methanolobus profundi]SFM30519.1 S-layer family duplication domain-containing protein [Methanolobus profundi]